MNLAEQWQALASTLGAADDVAARWLDELTRRYSESHRRYHTLRHIEEMLALLPDASPAVLAAAWFHDAIYDTVHTDSEERSADLAVHALRELGADEATIDRVAKMIRATTKHDPTGLADDELRFLDADLAILGSDPERYREYCDGVRDEYEWVPRMMFDHGRRGVLERFLRRERIYFTDDLRARFEARARENVSGELAGL